MDGYSKLYTKNMCGTVDIKCHKFDCDNGTLHVDHVNNRVGVGTKTPSTKLDVVGGIVVSGDLAIDTNTLVVDSANNRVGICTTSPTVALDITGGTKISGNLTVDTNTLVVDSANNYVGIGTATPNNPLELAGDFYMSGAPRSIWIGGNTDASAQKIRITQNGSTAYFDFTGDGKLQFRSGTTPGTNQFMTLDGTNKRLYIGGSSNPSYTLDVGGTARVSSLLVTNSVQCTTMGATYADSLYLRGTHSSSSGHSIGATNIVNATNNSSNTAVGTYQRMYGWGTAGASHTITIANYACNASNDNFACTMRIYTSNKANTSPKVGILTCDILKEYGTNVAVTTISTTKNANLTAFSVAGSTNDLVVTTDSDCLISWTIIGGI